MEFTDEFIAQQKELAAKATPRPWSIAGRPPCIVDNPPGPCHEIICWGKDGNRHGETDNWNDLSYLVSAANHWEAALDEIERLKLSNGMMYAMLDNIAANQSDRIDLIVESVRETLAEIDSQP